MDGDCSKMPYYTTTSKESKIDTTNLISTILKRYQIKDSVYQKMTQHSNSNFEPSSLRFYNPFDTPYEDTMLTELSQRLRLVNTASKSCLILSEDSKFIKKLKEYIQLAALPFFTIVNEISILFEVSNDAVRQSGSIQKLVFGSIRKYKPLQHFLTNVITNLKVLLRTYDSDIDEAMDWKEMLAYLSDYRNPFVTVQLLPEYIEPINGVITQIPDDMKQSKIPDGDINRTSTMDVMDIDNSSTTPTSLIYKSQTDLDGGTHPSWNQQFLIPFQPPKLTNCPILFTDVMELFIDNIRKYIIVMVRVGEDKSLFMTAYDPRTSTDYLLFGNPMEWTQPGIASMNVKELKDCCHIKDPTIKSSLDLFQKQLDLLIDQHNNSDTKNIFRLGSAITPRLLVSVYNQKNQSDVELLGYSQVSISSVLSGTGNRITYWARLMHETNSSIGGKSQITYLNAGAVQLELEYTLESELEAKEESIIKAKERKKTILTGEKVVEKGFVGKSEEGKGVREELSGKEEEYRNDLKVLQKQKGDLEKIIQDIQQVKIPSLSDENQKLALEQQELREEIQKLNALIEEKRSELSLIARSREDDPKRETKGRIDPKVPHGDVDGECPDRSDGSVENIVRGIVDIFIQRYHKRNQNTLTSHSSSASRAPNAAVILQPFLRAIKGYLIEKAGKDEITAYALEQLLNDLLIELTSTDAEVFLISSFLDI